MRPRISAHRALMSGSSSDASVSRSAGSIVRDSSIFASARSFSRPAGSLENALVPAPGRGGSAQPGTKHADADYHGETTASPFHPFLLRAISRDTSVRCWSIMPPRAFIEGEMTVRRWPGECMAAQIANYAPGDTFLHRLHPLSKLARRGARLDRGLSLRVLDRARGARPVPRASPCAEAIGFARLRAVFASLPLFVAIIVLANVFLVRAGDPRGKTRGPGSCRALRIVVIIVAANLFLAVTDPIDLADAV